MKRYWPGVAMAALPAAVFVVLEAMKAAGVGPRRIAFALEGALSYWPQVLWQGSWVYPGQRLGMFASYGLVHRSAAEFAVATGLVLMLSGLAVRAAGVWRTVAVFVAALVLAAPVQGMISVEPFAGMVAGVAGLAGALAVWSAGRPLGPRPSPLLALAAGAGAWLALASPAGLVCGGLVAGVLVGAALKRKGAAPGDGA